MFKNPDTNYLRAKVPPPHPSLSFLVLGEAGMASSVRSLS